MKRTLVYLLCAIGLVGCTTTHETTTREPAARPAAARSEGDLKLGAQAWTFNNLTFFEAVDRTASLGVHYIESFPGQNIGGGVDGKMSPDMDAATREKVLAKCKAAGVTLNSFGVTGAGDEAGWRKLLEFAKAMGMKTVVSEPELAQMEMIDKLCNEYGINMAIHDHPKPSRYWNPDTVLEAIKGRSKRVGACADVGHWVRSGLDPVESLKKLEGHVIESHFKDLSAKSPSAHDVPWGTGVSNVKAMLAELKRQKFNGVCLIEYEHNTPELMSNLARCVEYFNTCAPMSAADLLAGKAMLPGTVTDPKQVWAKVKVDDTGKWPRLDKPVFKNDLSNAQFNPGSWAIENGVLTAKGGGDIWTKEKYTNFVLDLDFKCEKDTNSGVILRCTDTVAWSLTSLEIQILQTDDDNKKHTCGAVFDCVAPSKAMIKPAGEWNHYTITAKDNKIEVVLNGERVVDMNLDDWKETQKNPDGTPNKYERPVKDLPREGVIGMQYHDQPVWFRNLMIKPAL